MGLALVHFQKYYQDSGFPSKMFGIFKNMSLFCATVFYCSKTGFHSCLLLCKGESPLRVVNQNKQQFRDAGGGGQGGM